MPSAGLIPYRVIGDDVEILIAHPGGPFWARKHEGAWSIVKGEIPPGEDPQATAFREFREETGWLVEGTDAIPLGTVTQKAGKRITAWAIAADFDPAELAGDEVTIEWRGRTLTFPEIDEVRWCDGEESARLLNPAQIVYFARLRKALELDE